jgi:hypothetical protein
VPGSVDGALETAGLGIRPWPPSAPSACVTVVGGSAPPPLRGIRVDQLWISAGGTALADLAGMDLTLRVAGVLLLERAAEAPDRLAAGGIRGRLVLPAS